MSGVIGESEGVLASLAGSRKASVRILHLRLELGSEKCVRVSQVKCRAAGGKGMFPKQHTKINSSMNKGVKALNSNEIHRALQETMCY